HRVLRLRTVGLSQRETAQSPPRSAPRLAPLWRRLRDSGGEDRGIHREGGEKVEGGEAVLVCASRRGGGRRRQIHHRKEGAFVGIRRHFAAGVLPLPFLGLSLASGNPAGQTPGFHAVQLRRIEAQRHPPSSLPILRPHRRGRNRRTGPPLQPPNVNGAFHRGRRLIENLFGRIGLSRIAGPFNPLEGRCQHA